jgi:acylphosphatase
MMGRIRLIIYGNVHGVGFRFSAVETARDLGLVGWVRNKPDRSVEILAEGPKGDLEKLINWAKKGPFLANVAKIETSWEKATGEFTSFGVEY